jgi:hypothetical protein
MIRSFKIIALTKKGEEVLTNNLNEYHKLPPQGKLMWKALFRRTVTNDPLTLDVKVKNSTLGNMLNPEDVIRKLKESMKNEKARENIDYKIEVKK